MNKHYYVFILSNKRNGVLYVGLTHDLASNLRQYKRGGGNWFIQKYNCNNLVRYKEFSSSDEAFEQESQISGRSRFQKMSFIERMNPFWKDMSGKIAQIA